MIRVNPDTDALFVIDAQPTFMPGGGLPVPDGDLIIPVILDTLLKFPFHRRFATRDQHPKGHISLASSYHEMLKPFHELTLDEVMSWHRTGGVYLNLSRRNRFSGKQLMNYLKMVPGQKQMLWPDHGLIGSKEAELHPDLREDMFWMVWHKGQDPACDSYSAFLDNLRRPTGLGYIVQEQNVTRGFYTGLADDVCVIASALDGMEYGIKPYIVMDATKPVSVEGAAGAWKMGEAAGVVYINSSELEAA